VASSYRMQAADACTAHLSVSIDLWAALRSTLQPSRSRSHWPIGGSLPATDGAQHYQPPAGAGSHPVVAITVADRDTCAAGLPGTESPMAGGRRQSDHDRHHGRHSPHARIVLQSVWRSQPATLRGASFTRFGRWPGISFGASSIVRLTPMGDSPLGSLRITACATAPRGTRSCRPSSSPLRVAKSSL
jgi:hypothetical protein